MPRPPRPEEITLPAGAVMPMRKLGRTGVDVSLRSTRPRGISTAPHSNPWWLETASLAKPS